MPTSELLSTLRSGPAVLLLGQRVLSQGRAEDPLLGLVQRKFAAPGSSLESFHDLFALGLEGQSESALAWLADKAKKITAGAYLETLARFAWSAVYSSAIDPVWHTAFRNEWREVAPVLDESYRPLDARNRAHLYCTYLFGRVNQDDERHRPPLDRFQLGRRRLVAISLLRRLPELVTPLGTLVIDCHAGSQDWLTFDDLLPVLYEFTPGQVHVFDPTGLWADHQDVETLVRDRKVTIHRGTLGQFLIEAHESGSIELDHEPDEIGVGRSITFGGKSVSVPRDIWNQVARSAAILDDSVSLPPVALSAERRYTEFRQFLWGSDAKPDWTHHARHFPFRRFFEEPLFREVEKRLRDKRLSDDPLIVHGQTGTGKSIALAALAFRVRSKLGYPVLLVEHRSRRPLAPDIDTFCKWAEDSGAQACLIVWDGMMDVEEYGRFLRQLTGRGRKVVLVGSTYRAAPGASSTPSLVLAPDALDGEELSALRSHLARIDPDLAYLVPASAAKVDNSFLVALYRLLPETRQAIRRGLTREAEHAESAIQIRRSESQASSAAGSLAAALVKAGLVRPMNAEIEHVDGERFDQAQLLTLLVMVPAQYGLRIPFELVLRVLEKPSSVDWGDVFRRLDIFRWSEDNVGNIDLGARNRLEAQLLVQSRLGTPRGEVGVATRLVENLSDQSLGDRESSDIPFAVDLLRAMGSQGDRAATFAPYFAELANALERLRLSRSVENPRLMLQEANLLREWAKVIAPQDSLHASKRLDAFNKAEEVIRRAIELVEHQGRYGNLKLNLLGELASNAASRVIYGIDTGLRSPELMATYRSAQRAIIDARLADPTAYHPVDVLAWSTEALYRSGGLEGVDAVEAIADVYDSFASLDPESLDSTQRVNYHRRMLAFAERLGDFSVADDAFEKLRRIGSGAGFYLRAFAMAELSRAADAWTTANLQNLKAALEFLDKNADEVRADSRCANLRLDLWWFVKAGDRFLRGERVALPFKSIDWRALLELLTDVEGAGAGVRSDTIEFLRGLAVFHLGRVDECRLVFRRLDAALERGLGRRRIIRSYLASDESGQPRKYHGTVSSLYSQGRRGDVYVEELSIPIPFLVHEFSGSELSRDESIGEFHVAFNFRGPIADPPQYYRK